MAEDIGLVVSLCDYTGNMVRPWAEAGYYCMCFDVRHEATREERVGKGVIRYVPSDLNKLRPFCVPRIGFAFPSCTNGAVSGARWFQTKGLRGLIEYLELVESCRHALELFGCPWMLENPVSTLSTYWRKPDYTFHPWEYAGYPGGENDTYTKKTCIWAGNGFVMPDKRPLSGAVIDDRIHLMSPSSDRGDKRAVTPVGFARAVFEANRTVCEVPGMPAPLLCTGPETHERQVQDGSN